jgi:hypothetical protein
VKSYPSICLERLRKTTKILSKDIRSPGRDLSPGHPEYVSEHENEGESVSEGDTGTT